MAIRGTVLSEMTPEQRRRLIDSHQRSRSSGNGEILARRAHDPLELSRLAMAKCYRRYGLTPPVECQTPAPQLDADVVDNSLLDATIRCWLRYKADPTGEPWFPAVQTKVVKAALAKSRKPVRRPARRKVVARSPRRRLIASPSEHSTCSAVNGEVCRHCGDACLLRKRWNSTTTIKGVSTKLVSGAIVQRDPKYARCVSAVISTDRRDRDGEVLLPAGCMLDDYRRNPVVMWAHDYSGEPLGKCLEIERNKDAVWALIQFADTPRGLEVFKLYQSGVLNAFSVGFSPADSKWREATPEDTRRWPGVKRVYYRWSLLEISCVPVPANGDALVEAVNAGEITETIESFAA